MWACLRVSAGWCEDQPEAPECPHKMASAARRGRAAPVKKKSKCVKRCDFEHAHGRVRGVTLNIQEAGLDVLLIYPDCSCNILRPSPARH